MALICAFVYVPCLLFVVSYTAQADSPSLRLCVYHVSFYFFFTAQVFTRVCVSHVFAVWYSVQLRRVVLLCTHVNATYSSILSHR